MGGKGLQGLLSGHQAESLVTHQRSLCLGRLGNLPGVFSLVKWGYYQTRQDCYED